MPLDYVGLKAEDAKPAYSGFADAHRLTLFNALQTQTVSRGVVPATQLYGDLAQFQVPYKISLLPDNLLPVNLGTEENPVLIPIGAVKFAIIDLTRSLEANTADATVQGMIAAGKAFGQMVGATILTDEQITGLLTKEIQVSIGNTLGFDVVTQDDLNTARRQ